MLGSVGAARSPLGLPQESARALSSMLSDHVPGIWLALQLATAGLTLQLAFQHGARWYRRREDRVALHFAAWAGALTFVLITNAAVFATPVDRLGPALLARTIAISIAGVLLIPVAASSAGQSVPVPAVVVVGAIMTLRTGLWVATDLVYEHRIDADGAPVYGVLAGPLGLAAVLIATVSLIRVGLRWPDRVERLSFFAGHVAGLGIVTGAVVTAGPWSELLAGLWILPMAVALQLISGRRLARTDRRERRLAADRERITAELARSEARARLALESGQMAWYEYQPRTGAVSTSPDRPQLVDEPLDEHTIRSLIAEAMGEPTGVAEVERTEEGDERWLEITARLAGDPYEPTVIGVVKDITARKQAEEDALRAARRDPLTGLANRTALFAAVAEGLEEGTGFGLLLMDLDRFREINETLGHHVGDQVLQRVAARLRSTARPDDLVARLGGDEFALVVHPADSAEVVAQLALRSLAAEIDIDGVGVRVGASVGVVEAPADGTDAVTLVRRADAAMYRAKVRRSGWARHDAQDEAAAAAQLALVAQLEPALAGGAIRPSFQPTVDLATGTVGTVEALARWMHPDRGTVPPVEFVPLAEQYGMGRELFLRILDSALSTCAIWRHHELASSVAVNVSPLTLCDDRLVGDVATALAAARLPGDALVLEITEDTFAEEGEDVLRRLTELRDLGVSLAIDDFGTGYSSLAYLKRLPVQMLKLDRAFISDLVTGSADASLVELTIQVAHRLGMTVVAEGVEREETVDVLRSLGCDTVQGFGICRPADAPTVSAWLRSDAAARYRATGSGPAATAGSDVNRPPTSRR